MDVGRNAQEMIQLYMESCEEVSNKKKGVKNCPKLHITAIIQQHRQQNTLFKSDFQARRKLGDVARDPETQIRQFLGVEVPFVKVIKFDSLKHAWPSKFDLEAIIEEKQEQMKRRAEEAKENEESEDEESEEESEDEESDEKTCYKTSSEKASHDRLDNKDIVIEEDLEKRSPKASKHTEGQSPTQKPLITYSKKPQSPFKNPFF